MKRYLLAMGLLFAQLIQSGCATAPVADVRMQLVETAEAWLRILDEERYDEAWAQTALDFKVAVPYDNFLRVARGTRGPLGSSLKRELWDTRFRTFAEGLPDGEYFEASFETAFRKKSAKSIEHVLLKNDAGAWKVTMYKLH